MEECVLTSHLKTNEQVIFERARDYARARMRARALVGATVGGLAMLLYCICLSLAFAFFGYFHLNLRYLGETVALLYAVTALVTGLCIYSLERRQYWKSIWQFVDNPDAYPEIWLAEQAFLANRRARRWNPVSVFIAAPLWAAIKIPTKTVKYLCHG
jgi:hypothetical protein